MSSWGSRGRWRVGAPGRLLRLLVSGVIVAAALVPSGFSGVTAAPSRAEVDAARARLMELERDFQLVSERYNLINARLESILKRVASAEREMRVVSTRMRATTHDAVALATQIYKNGSTGGLETLLTARSLADLESSLEYMRTASEVQQHVFLRLTRDRAVLDAKVAELQAAQRAATATRSRLDELRATIEAKVADQRDEIDRLNAAIAAAERRAAQRRARAAAAAARAAAAVAPTRQIGVVADDVGAAPAPNPSAQTAVDAALSQVGKPYRWGAAGPDAYDCSGLTMWAWARAGVSLPHNSGAQYSATRRVARSDWQPGDLLFFGSPIHHVAMYIGNGRMVEAPYSGRSVRVVPASRSDYVGAGRPGV